ncbi:hypothetical protein KKC45_02915 [Patescibacteria group bacterium]|nr:hypothetical protein [Patescibacteria group bacterium]
MPKNVLQDVMPPKRRSIRDIPLSGNRKVHEDSSGHLSNFSGPIEGIRSSKKPGNFFKIKWWLVVIVILIASFTVFTIFFSGAKIVLVPKQEVIDFEANLVGVREDSNSELEGVPYSILKISSDGFRATSNVTEKEVEKKASGEITIFNEYSSSSERLIINTRFETPDGKIYRTPKSVTVPGKTTRDGKVIPGSVTITVYADSSGEAYNIGLVDFTIPGFKGTDRFSKFYARSKSPMEGGFSGVMKIVEDSELKQMKEDIHEDLKKELRDSVYSQIPEGFVLFNDGIYINFESQNNIDLGDSVQVVEKGILNAVIFDKIGLSNYLSRNVVSLTDNEVEIANIDELDFSIDKREYVNPWEDVSFDFSLGGTPNFIWVFDEQKMKEDFAGQPKKNANSLLANYDGIKEAEVTMSPFWKMNFPSDVDKIDIERVIK